MTRKIGFFSGTRAELSLLDPVIKAAKNFDGTSIILYLATLHTDINSISLDYKLKGIDVREVPIPDASISGAKVYKSISHGINSLGEIFEETKPDILILYADRYETFAAAIAASHLLIPVVHIEGGDLTSGGTLDDTVRHAITKLSHIHLPTNKKAADYLKRTGEESWRIMNIGLPTHQQILELDHSSNDDLVGSIGLDNEKDIILFTQHPVHSELVVLKHNIRESLKALLDGLSKGRQVIITYPNNDCGADIIIKEIKEFDFSIYSKHVHVIKNLGMSRYYRLLSLSSIGKIKIVCVGNSSSGIKETIFFNTMTVNIGNRQSGRLCAKNVLNCTNDTKDIINTMDIAFDHEYKEVVELCRDNPYLPEITLDMALSFLIKLELGRSLTTKRFY
jgi:UDP-hydrolysing UDP-N-acetyl-D-glucosamine 2-epimerase